MVVEPCIIYRVGHALFAGGCGIWIKTRCKHGKFHVVYTRACKINMLLFNTKPHPFGHLTGGNPAKRGVSAGILYG